MSPRSHQLSVAPQLEGGSLGAPLASTLKCGPVLSVAVLGCPEDIVSLKSSPVSVWVLQSFSPIADDGSLTLGGSVPLVAVIHGHLVSVLCGTRSVSVLSIAQRNFPDEV